MILRASINHLEVKKDDHPNRLNFSGTLLYLDSPSQKAPHGSEGHRIYVSKKVAEKRLHTLIGMPLNYSQDGMEAHDSQNAIGVITKPWIEGNKVKVSGYIWKKTFPEAHEDLHGKDLGMSMELADVEIEDRDADVWRLNDFYFTGASALWPDSAAYTSTSLAAAAQKLASDKGENMPDETKDKKKKVTTTQIGLATVTAISASVASKVSEAIAASQAPLISALTELSSAVKDLKAGSAEKTKTETAEEKATRELTEVLTAAEDVNAGEQPPWLKKGNDDKEKEKESDDSEEEDDEEEDEEDTEEMEGAEGGTGDLEDVNDDAAIANKGNKTTTTGPPGGANVDKDKTVVKAGASKQTVSALKAAASAVSTMKAQIGTLSSELAKEKANRKRLATRMEAMEAQLQAAAERTNRRTVTPELLNMLEKNGVDIAAAQSGRKITVAFVDKMFDNLGFPLDVDMRMGFKNQLLSAGILDPGRSN